MIPPKAVCTKFTRYNRIKKTGYVANASRLNEINQTERDRAAPRSGPKMADCSRTADSLLTFFWGWLNHFVFNQRIRSVKLNLVQSCFVIKFFALNVIT